MHVYMHMHMLYMYVYMYMHMLYVCMHMLYVYMYMHMLYVYLYMLYVCIHVHVGGVCGPQLSAYYLHRPPAPLPREQPVKPDSHKDWCLGKSCRVEQQ